MKQVKMLGKSLARVNENLCFSLLETYILDIKQTFTSHTPHSLSQK